MPILPELMEVNVALAAQLSRNEPSTQESARVDEWIPTKTVTAILGRSRYAVMTLVERGVLTMNRPGTSRPLFKRSEVIALAESQGIRVVAQ